MCALCHICARECGVLVPIRTAARKASGAVRALAVVRLLCPLRSASSALWKRFCPKFSTWNCASSGTAPSVAFSASHASMSEIMKPMSSLGMLDFIFIASSSAYIRKW